MLLIYIIEQIKDVIDDKTIKFQSKNGILSLVGKKYIHNITIATTNSKKYRISNFTIDFLQNLEKKLGDYNIKIKNLDY